MFQRLFDSTKWIWCVVVMSSGSLWSSVNSGAVPSQNAPSTIEAQAKFFQYRHLPTSEDFDQGHRLGSERHFIERHERSRPATGLFSAKVRWGDKKGGYGEHYWDLNHAGHVGNDENDDGYYNDSDDGSYHEDSQDTNDESNEQPQNYEIDEYNPDDNKNNYEENSRAKRAHTRTKSHQQKDEKVDDDQRQLTKEKLDINDKEKREDNDNEEEVTNRPLKIKPKRRLRPQYDTEVPHKKEKNNVVLVINHKQRDEKVELPKQPEPKRFMPYEGGAGVRQRMHPELVASASIPRLFLDQSTGHVIDRTTGQAFVLQPIPRNVHYS